MSQSQKIIVNIKVDNKEYKFNVEGIKKDNITTEINIVLPSNNENFNYLDQKLDNLFNNLNNDDIKNNNSNLNNLNNMNNLNNLNNINSLNNLNNMNSINLNSLNNDENLDEKEETEKNDGPIKNPGVVGRYPVEWRKIYETNAKFNSVKNNSDYEMYIDICQGIDLWLCNYMNSKPSENNLNFIKIVDKEFNKNLLKNIVNLSQNDYDKLINLMKLNIPNELVEAKNRRDVLIATINGIRNGILSYITDLIQ